MLGFGITTDFHELRHEPRDRGARAPWLTELFREDHMFRDDEPEPAEGDPTRRVSDSSQAVDGRHENCYRRRRR